MHIGFDTPTEEVMTEWNKWFDSIKDKTIENIGFGEGKEIIKGVEKDLTWGTDSVTGITIIEAESLEDAMEVAKTCPSITGVKVYEYRQ